jgi:hypothetical protein
MPAWERCEGRCAVSGLEFSEVQVGGGKARRPYAPSLDRIGPRRGDEPDNGRLRSRPAGVGLALELRVLHQHRE